MLLKSSFVLALWGAVVTAQSAGTFTTTGNMTTARAAHTATLLSNGKVLIAGGAQYVTVASTLVLASAELYDPITSTFTATGNMTTPRQQHTATLLADGRVLIEGGSQEHPGQTVDLASAEIYDPSTETFTATGDLSTAQHWLGATLLGDGKILVAGGISGEFPTTAAAQLMTLERACSGPRARTLLQYRGRVLEIGRPKPPFSPMAESWFWGCPSPPNSMIPAPACSVLRAYGFQKDSQSLVLGEFIACGRLASRGEDAERAAFLDRVELRAALDERVHHVPDVVRAERAEASLIAIALQHCHKHERIANLFAAVHVAYGSEKCVCSDAVLLRAGANIGVRKLEQVIGGYALRKRIAVLEVECLARRQDDLRRGLCLKQRSQVDNEGRVMRCWDLIDAIQQICPGQGRIGEDRVRRVLPNQLFQVAPVAFQ
jgi:hypothetical protein